MHSIGNNTGGTHSISRGAHAPAAAWQGAPAERQQQQQPCMQTASRQPHDGGASTAPASVPVLVCFTAAPLQGHHPPAAAVRLVLPAQRRQQGRHIMLLWMAVCAVVPEAAGAGAGRRQGTVEQAAPETRAHPLPQVKVQCGMPAHCRRRTCTRSMRLPTWAGGSGHGVEATDRPCKWQT